MKVDKDVLWRLEAQLDAAMNHLRLKQHCQAQSHIHIAVKITRKILGNTRVNKLISEGQTQGA